MDQKQAGGTPEETVSPDGAWIWRGGRWLPNLAAPGGTGDPGAKSSSPLPEQARKRPHKQQYLIGAAVVLAIVLAGAFALFRGGDGAATKVVWQQLDCAGRDLTSDDDDDEEHNKIWLCAIDALVEDISVQTDRYPTLTNEVLMPCGSDANGELGKDEEMAQCLLDAGL